MKQTSQPAESGDLHQDHPSMSITPKAKHLAAILDHSDTYIYAFVGFSFLIAAILALIYAYWSLVEQTLPALFKVSSGVFVVGLVDFISGLLLVLIIIEVLATVIHYLSSHETSLRPFIFIGIVSATRTLLVVSARLAVINPLPQEKFVQYIFELALSGLLIFLLAITLKILDKNASADLTRE